MKTIWKSPLFGNSEYWLRCKYATNSKNKPPEWEFRDCTHIKRNELPSDEWTIFCKTWSTFWTHGKLRLKVTLAFVAIFILLWKLSIKRNRGISGRKKRAREETSGSKKKSQRKSLALGVGNEAWQGPGLCNLDLYVSRIVPALLPLGLLLCSMKCSSFLVCRVTVQKP